MQLDLPDIELFLELLRYSAYRFNIISKLSLNFVSKEFMQRMHFPKHKSLLFYFIQVLFDELFTVESNEGTDRDSLAGNELFWSIKRLIHNIEEYPNMKSLPMLWAFESILTCHQIIEKYHQILDKINNSSSVSEAMELDEDFSFPLRRICVEEILQNPLYFADITKIVYYFGFQMTSNLEQYSDQFTNSDRNECRALIRELTNCFTFTIKCDETKKWMEFQQLYLAFLLGKNEIMKVRN
jgi:hypothetical protein